MNKNFILNSGSYFILWAIMTLFTLVKFIINKIAVYFARNPLARKLGIYIYSDSYWNEFKDGAMKLLMESYFDLAMCSLLNVLAFFEKVDGEY